MNTTSIGVDFGGTQIKIAKVQDADILQQTTVDTPRGASSGDVLGALAAGVLALDPHPKAVGLAIPGQVDQQGRVYRLPNVPGFEGVNIAAELSPLLECEVSVENDGNAAAHGEALYGVGRKYRSFAMITLGTGIGAGLVIDGRVRTGAYGFAAELGHICVDTRDWAWPCACGRNGCVEAYAGTGALLRKFKEHGGEAKEVLPVADSARRSEAAGVAAFTMMAESLGKGITILQTILDLDAIVFTGGVSKSFDLLEPLLRAEVEKLAYSEPLGRVPLRLSELGATAGVVGAAHLHRLKITSN